MTKRVYLHIGLPKTGTTYLQDSLWAQRAELRRRGLLIPGRHRRRHLLASFEVREDPSLARRPGDVTRPWGELVEEILASESDALVSHEFFSAAGVPQIQRVLDDLPGREVHVVITARALVEIGLSMWQESVKNGSAIALEKFPAPDSYRPTGVWGWAGIDLADVLTRWSAVIEPERIHVLPMRSTDDPALLWRRYLEVLGVDPEGLPPAEQPANESLGLVEIELLRRINPQLRDFKASYARGTWIRGYLAHGAVMPRSREKFTASTAKLAEFDERGQAAVELLRAGGYDVRGELDWLRPGDFSSRRRPEDVTDAELLDASTQLVAGMLGDVRRLTGEVKALGKQAATANPNAANPNAAEPAAADPAAEPAGRRWGRRK